ncbi:hypothetical protein I4U23_004803 [Adineta vaga]|nr:hypothetical protein I4U23_004803 [Adineta vaga]
MAHLENSFVKQPPYLHTFTVDIVTELLITDEEVDFSFDEIKLTFIQRRYHVDGDIDSNYYMNYMWH